MPVPPVTGPVTTMAPSHRNPSQGRAQPVPNGLATRPPVPTGPDGLSQPLSCADAVRDGWTGRPRTRPPVPKPGATGPLVTHASTPSQPTSTDTHGSADHAPATPTDTDDTTDTADPTDDNRVSKPQPGTSGRRSQSRARTTARRRAGDRATREATPGIGDLSGPMPTPEQWAQQQLTHAPPRSRAWARSVAALYGLELPNK